MFRRSDLIAGLAVIALLALPFAGHAAQQPMLPGTGDPPFEEASRTQAHGDTHATGALDPSVAGISTVFDFYTTPEDTPLLLDVLANDAGDIDPMSLQVTASTDRGGLTALEDGTIRYVPDPDFFGLDEFQYHVCSHAGYCAPAGVVIHVTPVNDAPHTHSDFFLLHEERLGVLDILANDLDLDSTLLQGSIQALSQPSHGFLEIREAQVTYAPDPDFQGIDRFWYRFCDDLGACNDAEVILGVQNINDAPIAYDDVAFVSQYVPTILAPHFNDVDPDGSPVRIVDVFDGAWGSTKLLADGTVRYSPDPGFQGDSFRYVLSDGLATSTGIVHLIDNGCGNGTYEDGEVSGSIQSLEELLFLVPEVASIIQIANCAGVIVLEATVEEVLLTVDALILEIQAMVDQGIADAEAGAAMIEALLLATVDEVLAGVPAAAGPVPVQQISYQEALDAGWLQGMDVDLSKVRLLA